MLCVAVLAILATAHRGDPSLWPPRDGDPRTDIFVVSNGYHTGVVLPRAALAAAAGRQGAGAALELASRPCQPIHGSRSAGATRGVLPQRLYCGVGLARLAFRALFRSNASVLHSGVGLAGQPAQHAMFPQAEMVRIGVGADGFDRVLGMVDRTLARGPDDRRKSGSQAPTCMARTCSFAPRRMPAFSTSAISAGGQAARRCRRPAHRRRARHLAGWACSLDVLRWRAGLTPLPADPPSAPT